MSRTAKGGLLFRSLYMKLVLILILLIVSLMAVVGIFLINGVSQFYMDEFVLQMSSAFNENENFARSLYAQLDSQSPAAGLSDAVRTHSAILGIDGRQRFFFILDGRGEPVAGDMESGVAGRIDLSLNILTAMNGAPGYALSVTDPFFDCAVPIGGYIIYIYDTKASLQRETKALVTIVVTALLFGMLISILLALLLSKTMTTPIESLTRSASRVADGDFSKVPEVRSSDEIGILTRTFNHMAQVLADTLEAVGSERDKFGTLFLHMTDGMLAFTWEGALLHINPAAIRLLKIPADTRPDFNALLGGIVSMAELRGLTPPDYAEKSAERGGTHLQIFFAPFGAETDEGGNGGFMAVVHDITEQMKLDAVRREFVSNVSHELRTPLTNVKSYAETMLVADSLTGDTLRNFASVIVSEADRMTRIVQDLLTLSKFDYGKMDWRVSRVDLLTILPSVRQAMLIEAQRRGHELILELPEHLPVIYGDRERLEQVLFNILSNAMTYTPDGGVILLRAAARGGTLTISVTDNGIGIPEEDLPRLFERFYRVDKARSRSLGGTGLGLSIAREIIQKHNGDIRADSVVGQGTTVTIRLPVRREDEFDA